MNKEELILEAEAFDAEVSTRDILLELVRLPETPEFLAEARKALERFYAQAEHDLKRPDA